MDKNIAALMRQDCKTVHVRFWKDRNDNSASYSGKNPVSLSLGTVPMDAFSDKRYTYITDLDLKEGDWALVLVSGIPKVVTVVAVDEDCEIEPNDNVAYKWVFGKVDTTNYYENLKKNEEIEGIVSSAYKKSLRAQFSQLLLAGTDAETQLRLQDLITKKVVGETS